MTEVKSIEDIKHLYHHGEYESKIEVGSKISERNLPIDGDKSYNWNIEEMNRFNATIDQNKENKAKESLELQKKLDQDILLAIQDEGKVSESHAKIIYAFASGEKKGWELFEFLENLTDLFYKIHLSK